MHELSIVVSVVRSISEAVADHQAATVKTVVLRVGALAGVEREALLFSWELATEGTALHGAELAIDTVPVAIYCQPCAQEKTLDGIQSFRCPKCGTPSGDLRAGRELMIASVTLETEAASV